MKDEAMKQALEALEQTLQTLDDENSKPGGAIADTIWHSEHVTLFDYLASEITALREALAQPEQEQEQEPVAKPYAYEYGRCNADGTYSVVIDKGDLVQTMPAVYNYVRPRNAHKDWPIKELFDRPPQPKQEPLACKTMCELCIKRGYTFCANAVKTTPIPTPPQRTEQKQPTDIGALVQGMEVSIDVSTGDHDAGHRLFGTVTLVQENQGSKHGLILLVQDPEPNFKAQRKPWVDLTDDEIQAVAKQARSKDHAVTLTNKFLRDKNT